MIVSILLLVLNVPAQMRSVPSPTGIPMSGQVALKVTFGKTSRAAAGAEIRFREVDEYTCLDLRRTPGARIDELLEGSPIAGRTDGDGRARLALSARPILLEVRSGKWWWAQSFCPCWLQGFEDERTVEIELLEDYDLDVLAVDARHQPLVGVPVALRRYQEYDPLDTPPTLTDTTGHARLRHAGFLVHQSEGRNDVRTMVAVSSCLANPVEQRIDPSTRPMQAIELLLPPTGVVELAFEDADGKPIRADAGLGLTSEWKAPLMEYSAVPGTSMVLSPHRTSVTFPYVGLGLDLHAWAQRNGASELMHAASRGPRTAGEHVRIAVKPSPGQRGLAGRLVDSTGKAVANRDFSVGTLCKPEVFEPDGVPVQCTRGHSSLLGIGMRTDEDGSFRIDMGDNWDLPKAAEFQFDALEVPLAARAPVAQPDFDGVLDLGPLELREPRTIFRGRVVDDLDHAVAGAIVSFEEPEGWFPGPFLSVSTRADGGFEFQRGPEGFQANGSYRIMAQREGHAGEALPITLGPQAVRTITLPRASRLRGHLAPAAGVSMNECWLDWGAEDAATKLLPGRHGRRPLERDGSFVLPNLHPGSYFLSVSGPCQRSYKGIVCRAGEDRDLGELK